MATLLAPLVVRMYIIVERANGICKSGSVDVDKFKIVL